VTSSLAMFEAAIRVKSR